VTFKAPSAHENWIWKGSAGAAGQGNTIKVVFPSYSADIADTKTVTATLGGNTITANVIVFDLFPILIPKDNFPGRDLDAYGVCEFINLSYKTVPAVISEADLGGLRWIIEKGGGDLYGAEGGVATYQCSDVGGSFVVSLQYVGRPFLGAQAQKK
jgi:hypothetical protein